MREPQRFTVCLPPTPNPCPKTSSPTLAQAARAPSSTTAGTPPSPPPPRPQNPKSQRTVRNIASYASDIYHMHCSYALHISYPIFAPIPCFHMPHAAAAIFTPIRSQHCTSPQATACHMSYATHHMPHVTCHISHVTYHMSHVTYHMSHVTCHISPQATAWAAASRV